MITYHKQTIDPGAGYRLLQPGEIIQFGDEYLNSGIWFPRHFSEGIAVRDTFYPTRRKVDPITQDQERIEVLMSLLDLVVSASDGSAYDGGFSYRLLRRLWESKRGDLSDCRKIAERVRVSRAPAMPVPP